MVLSKSCIYAIKSVLYIATQKDRNHVSVREISNKFGISFHYLTKILQILNHAGILDSTKGPKGGISFKRPPARITVYEIVYAIDGDNIFTNCSLGLALCSDKNPCAIHKLLHFEKSTFQQCLKEETIQTIADKIESDKFSLLDQTILR